MGAKATRWLEQAHRSLAGAGSRSGGARDEVMEVLAREGCLLSAQQIHDLLRDQGRRVGMASVYRTLELLASGEHHHHLVCERCGQMIAFADPELERALETAQERLGVAGAEHEVIVRALCPACRTAQPLVPAARSR